MKAAKRKRSKDSKRLLVFNPDGSVGLSPELHARLDKLQHINGAEPIEPAALALVIAAQAHAPGSNSNSDLCAMDTESDSIADDFLRCFWELARKIGPTLWAAHKPEEFESMRDRLLRDFRELIDAALPHVGQSSAFDCEAVGLILEMRLLGIKLRKEPTKLELRIHAERTVGKFSDRTWTRLLIHAGLSTLPEARGYGKRTRQS